MTLDEARERMGEYMRDDGSLYCLGWYLSWGRGESVARPDGDFSADDLEAIALIMRSDVILRERNSAKQGDSDASAL